MSADAAVAGADTDDERRVVIARLARPHASGGYVVDEAAIRAEGTGSGALREWILAHGGTPEAPPPARDHGLHGSGRSAGGGAGKARRYLLPADALA